MGDPFGIRWFLPLKGTMIDETVNKLSKEMCIVIHEKDEYYVFSNKQFLAELAILINQSFKIVVSSFSNSDFGTDEKASK